ncbi:CipC1 protein [Butyriboletus roseoflavus]|nr:CipC1 protein [Butyriboletus roseoflavus]
MGWLEAFQNDHNEVHHKGSLTHDALAGAVAYEAAKAYEDHLATNGQPDSHAKAKEILAGFAGVALTQLAETKGRDAWDAHKRRQIQEQAQERLRETILVEQYS